MCVCVCVRARVHVRASESPVQPSVCDAAVNCVRTFFQWSPQKKQCAKVLSCEIVCKMLVAQLLAT